MTISEVIRKMIDFSDGNLHDINHFMKVCAYAKVIGESEHLDRETQDILEVAAVVHDIACPLCREKYGNTNGKYQEQEGAVLAKEFLKDSGFPPAFISRVSYLVGHHHTLEAIEGPDYQILIEADYLVNAGESHYPQANKRYMLEKVFKTEAGVSLLKSMYRLT